MRGQYEDESLESGMGGLDWIDPAQGKGQVAVTCQRGNEPSGSIKYDEFLD
jgi:hypothetical protein